MVPLAFTSTSRYARLFAGMLVIPFTGTKSMFTNVVLLLVRCLALPRRNVVGTGGVVRVLSRTRLDGTTCCLTGDSPKRRGNMLTRRAGCLTGGILLGARLDGGSGGGGGAPRRRGGDRSRVSSDRPYMRESSDWLRTRARIEFVRATSIGVRPLRLAISNRAPYVTRKLTTPRWSRSTA